MLMLQMANINFFLTILTKTYPAVLMPSKGVPQILECLFQLRRYAGSTNHAIVRVTFFDSALLLPRKWVFNSFVCMAGRADGSFRIIATREPRSPLGASTLAEVSLSMRGTSGERAGERGSFHRIVALF
jgi:hypothetical protein